TGAGLGAGVDDEDEAALLGTTGASSMGPLLVLFDAVDCDGDFFAVEFLLDDLHPAVSIDAISKDATSDQRLRNMMSPFQIRRDRRIVVGAADKRQVR